MNGILWQQASMLYALKNSSSVGKNWIFRLIWRVVWSFVSEPVFRHCLRVATVISEMSSSVSESSVLSVFRCDNTSAAWCLILALWTMSISYSKSRSIHLTSFSVASAKFRIHFNCLWSVLTVSLDPSKYGRCSSIAQTAERHAQCLLSRFLSQSFKILAH